MQVGTKLIRLSLDSQIKSFDCGDSDLNEFLINDSKGFILNLLAVTYVIEDNQNTIAFFSLLNDKISILDTESKSQWRKLVKDKLPYGKRYNSYPAMKIGRLGVSLLYKNQGWGTDILNYLKDLFVNNNRTGCRFITVDAYRDSLKFYEKNGFQYLTSTDKNSDTRLMFYDLKQL
ncbi:MAG: GNAT family N-acetyltransferase [Paludibacter sp.]